MRVVQYQTGVDVLGFPEYIQRFISQHTGLQDKKYRVLVTTKTIKQH